MRKLLLLVAILYSSSIIADSSLEPKISQIDSKVCAIDNKVESIQSDIKDMSKPRAVAKEGERVLSRETDILVSVIGQGVAPMNTASPAQAYALAKRAATADAYRLIAEKVVGVRIDGQDSIKNMMVKRSTIRTSVKAMVRNANIVETTFKEGLCEVEMEILISYSDFAL
ncbi:hypothetical protein M947_09540 [Sulfurimonas hongkongensis]|uniref:Lipoprotein LPP20-like domain-containing protein n=1 Tax=Sulfurimonas hongkongensis TaxID=1172190 RepID=T0JF69_9BACT|nr:LPP20 family lipoprotein [Sulfurimonas hongkongensis]EQB35517.1 hypothetical protein M947_09540 [Sulfurimonas hongkongensis]